MTAVRLTYFSLSLSQCSTTCKLLISEKSPDATLTSHTCSGVTAQATLAKLGAKRVAIVDIDVHHGNGAERGFYGRKDVLTISIHQDRNFPYNRGFTTDRGEGEGFGYK